MPQCASVIKTAASSYNIAVCSGIFIPTALIPALLIIIAIIKDPFKDIKTQVNMFVMASSVASLLSVPVSGLRTWFHTLNATGINAYKERLLVVPALHACHFVWFMIHFVATICIFAIVLMQMFDRLSVAKEFSGKYSTVYKFIVIATWIIGAIFGSCVQLTGMSLMTKIQTAVHCVVAVTSLTFAYFCVYLPLEEDGQADVTKERTTNSNDIEVLQKDGSSPNAIVINKIPPVEVVEMNENIVQANIMCVREEAMATVYKTMLYFCCAMPSGVLLLIFHYADSMTCTQMFWVKDVSTLCLPLFLAVHPIFCIVYSPKMKRAVNHILGIKDSVVHPSGALNG